MDRMTHSEHHSKHFYRTVTSIVSASVTIKGWGNPNGLSREFPSLYWDITLVSSLLMVLLKLFAPSEGQTETKGTLVSYL